MKLLRTNQNSVWPRRTEYHVLTYAEEGFSPLNIHTRDTSISKDDLVAFAAQINDRNELGTLYPRAAVSAVPRAVIRDSQDPIALCRAIEEFLDVNAKSIRAKKLLFDFRTPNVSRFVMAAIEKALACPTAAMVEEVVVIDDAAT